MKVSEIKIGMVLQFRTVQATVKEINKTSFVMIQNYKGSEIELIIPFSNFENLHMNTDEIFEIKKVS